MTLSRSLGSALFVALVALACGGGNIAPYETCSSTDTSNTCGSGTVCESASTDSSTLGVQFCTYSCMLSSSCPSDETGTKGVCTDAFNVDQSNQGFCYRSCAASPCPTGSTCVDILDPLDEHISACQPNSSDPLGGTTWTSNTIAPIANSNAVTQSTYTMTFGAATNELGEATGDFSATFVQMFASNAITYAGCTETTTISGASYLELAPSTTQGVLEITDGSATSDRTGCKSAQDDVTDEGANLYIEDIEAETSTAFTISNGTMTIEGGTGILPYTDKVPWTFTEQ